MGAFEIGDLLFHRQDRRANAAFFAIKEAQGFRHPCGAPLLLLFQHIVDQLVHHIRCQHRIRHARRHQQGRGADVMTPTIVLINHALHPRGLTQQGNALQIAEAGLIKQPEFLDDCEQIVPRHHPLFHDLQLLQHIRIQRAGAGAAGLDRGLLDLDGGGGFIFTGQVEHMREGDQKPGADHNHEEERPSAHQAEKVSE